MGKRYVLRFKLCHDKSTHSTANSLRTQTIHHDSGRSEAAGLCVSKPKTPKPAVKNPTKPKTAKSGNVNEDQTLSVNCGVKTEGDDEDEDEDDWDDLGQVKKKKIDDEEWQEVTVGKELSTEAEKMYISDGDEERDLRHKATSAMRAVSKKVKGAIPEPVKKNSPPVAEMVKFGWKMLGDGLEGGVERRL